MGKIRIKTLGGEEMEKKQAQDAKVRRESKKFVKKEQDKTEKKDKSEKTKVPQGKGGEHTSSKVSKSPGSMKQVEEDGLPAARQEKAKKIIEEPASTKDSIDKEKPKKIKVRSHGANYQKAKKLLEVKKEYSLKKAVELLKKMNFTSFDQTVELHINTNIENLKGEVTLPHGTGKKVRVEVVSDAVLDNIENGKIDFDVLIAAPTDMPKLVKYAKILGPKGLMPNPKAGTVSAKPEEAVKKFSSGGIRFKTEPKAPFIHQTVGKMSFKEDALVENIDVFIKAVATKNISSIYLKATMTPSIKIKIE